MFDALHAGCIPLILSYDFVWPFSNNVDMTKNSDSKTPSTALLTPSTFSISLNAKDFDRPSYTKKCESSTAGLAHVNATIQHFLEGLPASELRRLRKGALKAADTYAYYSRRADLPDNPLREGILPDGGAAHALVQALADRAEGALWPACQEELERGSAKPNEKDATGFLC